MKNALTCIFAIAIVIVVSASLLSSQSPADVNQPRFGADNELAKPENYRSWVWLSSGLGMAYGPAAQSGGPANPPFDNVFVTPEAYGSFLQNGSWPDKTMFVLELRRSQNEGSINRQGRFQGDLIGMEVEVKDISRFPGGWGFFEFRQGATASKPLPASAECYSCHAQNGAVDNTFVQFYPTLIEVAKQKGTFKTTN